MAPADTVALKEFRGDLNLGDHAKMYNLSIHKPPCLYPGEPPACLPFTTHAREGTGREKGTVSLSNLPKWQD